MCIAHQRFLLRREPGRPFLSCWSPPLKPHVTTMRWTFPTVQSLTTCSIIFPGWGVRSRKQGGRCRACSLKWESIGYACRSKITTLLSPYKSKEFGKLYDLRSAYLHDEKVRGEV